MEVRVLPGLPYKRVHMFQGGENPLQGIWIGSIPIGSTINSRCCFVRSEGRNGHTLVCKTSTTGLDSPEVSHCAGVPGVVFGLEV